MLYSKIGETFLSPHMNFRYPIKIYKYQISFTFNGKYPIPQKPYLFLCAYKKYASIHFTLICYLQMG